MAEVSFSAGGARLDALLLRPEGARLLYVLAHGAGAGMRHPFLEAIAQALAAEGVATFRYEFPYLRAARKRPDPPAVLHATVRAAVLAAQEAAPDLPLIAGGKSFGGRMTTQSQGEAPLPGVRGIALLGFPETRRSLRNAGRPVDPKAVDRRADGRGRAHITTVKTLLIAAAILVACTTAPVTGRKQLNLVGDSTINQLGMQSYQQELAKAKTDTDPAHVDLVQRVSKRLADTAEAQFHPGYQWQTTVIDDPKTVNAWCMPGGKIAVYSGIFPITQDENGLAVVLAHEISHALAHHGAERLSRSELMQLGEAGLLAAVQAKKPGAAQMAGAALGLGSQLGVELPFSRQQESEADHIGLVLMAKAGYDPATAVDFWQRMLAYSKGKEPPAFLSDHPSSEQRIADIKRELPEAKAAFVAHK